jgi:hypothetical protein
LEGGLFGGEEIDRIRGGIFVIVVVFALSWAGQREERSELLEVWEM